MKDARSVESHSTSSATSSARPRRPTGWSATMAARVAASSPERRGVSMKAGPTAFTRIPRPAYSSAAFCVSPTIPCFAAT
jgi:hypothetical protein